MEDTALIENSDRQPDVQQDKAQEYKMSRRARRQWERQQSDGYKQRIKFAEGNIKHMKDQLLSLIKVYEQSYNDYVQTNPKNDKKLRSLSLPVSLNPVEAPLSDIISASAGWQIADLERCHVAGMPHLINILYLRVDINMIFEPDAEVKTRSGVPEKVEKYDDRIELQQLLYHAFLPIPTIVNSLEDKHNLILMEEKLWQDLISHIFCMGLDLQQMNNSRAWNEKMVKQSANMAEKVAEVTEMFSHLGSETTSKPQ